MSSSSLFTHCRPNCKGWGTHVNENCFLKKLGITAKSDLKEPTNNVTSAMHCFFKWQMRMQWFCDIRVKNTRPTHLETGDYLAFLISEQDKSCKLLCVPWFMPHSIYRQNRFCSPEHPKECISYICAVDEASPVAQW